MRIKELRRNVGITQMELADRLGVSRATVAMWETGQNWPSTQLLPYIAKALCCTINDLFISETA